MTDEIFFVIFENVENFEKNRQSKFRQNIHLFFVSSSLGALKWFDKYEPVMDVFWDIYVWCWVGVLLGCSSTLLAQLPVNSFTCPFNFVFNTTANTFLQIVHFTRCVQSWIHIRRQASIRKADVVAEVCRYSIVKSSRFKF